MSENEGGHINPLKEFLDDGYNRVSINRAIIELGNFELVQIDGVCLPKKF